jgi:integrase
VKLDLKDFKDDGEIKIRSGKGRVDRTVYLSTGAIALVNDWIEIRTTVRSVL